MYFLQFLQVSHFLLYSNCTVYIKLLLQVQLKNVNTDLQWFTVTSTLLHCKVQGKYLRLLHAFTGVSVFTVYVCSEESNFNLSARYKTINPKLVMKPFFEVTEEPKKG